MDVDVPQLPIAVTAPEWMEQKATIDGVFALAYGAYTHLSPTPFVTGAPTRAIVDSRCGRVNRREGRPRR